MPPEDTMKSPNLPRSGDSTERSLSGSKEDRDRPDKPNLIGLSMSINIVIRHVPVSHAVQKIGLDRRIRLGLDGLDPYHGSAALVMAAGSIGMILSLTLSIGPLWAGFLAIALPTFLFISLTHPEHA
jgi:hypothetical protein